MLKKIFSNPPFSKGGIGCYPPAPGDFSWSPLQRGTIHLDPRLLRHFLKPMAIHGVPFQGTCFTCSTYANGSVRLCRHQREHQVDVGHVPGVQRPGDMGSAQIKARERGRLRNDGDPQNLV